MQRRVNVKCVVQFRCCRRGVNQAYRLALKNLTKVSTASEALVACSGMFQSPLFQSDINDRQNIRRHKV